MAKTRKRVIRVTVLTSGAYIGHVELDQPDSKSSEICARVAGRSVAVAARAMMEVLANMLKKVNECGERNVVCKKVWPGTMEGESEERSTYRLTTASLAGERRDEASFI